MFNWPLFLQQHGIEFSGPDRDNLHVRCPFCGPDDPSHHMGISLLGKGWNCWRNPAHRGKSRSRIIMALLGCSANEAHRLAYGDRPPPLPDEEIGAVLRSKLLTEEIPNALARATKLPVECRPLFSGSLLERQFFNYLRGRGYRDTQLRTLCRTYDLHYCVRGQYAYRLVVPVRDRYGVLQTWVGRAILPDREPRYLTPKHEDTKVSVKHTLLGLDKLWSMAARPGSVLVVCEGPFDAMWVTTWGHSLSVFGTCLFGLSMSDTQAYLLDQLRRKFDYVALLLDSGAEFQAFRLANNGLELPVLRLPDDVKDPAALNPKRIARLCLSMREKALV